MDSNNCIKLESSEFISVLKEKLGHTGVNLTVTGGSMLPFLAGERDSVYLTKLSGKPKKGDIILYEKNGACILHRVKRVCDEGIYFIGDAQLKIDGPIDYSSLLAECRAAVRKGKAIHEKSFIWRFFRKIWINCIFLRKIFIKIAFKKNR